MLITEQLIQVLRERNLTCATAESCTGGGVGHAITAIPGASRVFRGGVISYDDSVKENVLGVSREILDGVGPVSTQCAAQMAVGARKLLNADIAVSVTGLAGPEGDGVHPVGFVCFGIATAEGVTAENVVIHGDREQIRSSAVAQAISMLLDKARKPKYED